MTAKTVDSVGNVHVKENLMKTAVFFLNHFSAAYLKKFLSVVPRLYVTFDLNTINNIVEREIG